MDDKQYRDEWESELSTMHYAGRCICTLCSTVQFRADCEY